jgi:hypothetical protein
VTPEKRALAAVWRHKGFCAFQALAIALWAALAVGWFWLPDSKSRDIVISAIGAWPVIIGAAWLIATSFVFYRRAHAGDDVRLSAVYREGLRRSPALLVWAAILVLALWLSLRPSAPHWIWIAVPTLLLPLGARMSVAGLRGAFQNVWSLRYFAQFAMLAAIGALLPYAVISWHPNLTGVGLQTASLVARFLVAYVLAIGSWLILASLLASAPPQATL